ncbi:MAG: hypothetical protein ACE5OO_03670 [Candidatus Bathyarchaeia archaeon]
MGKSHISSSCNTMSLKGVTGIPSMGRRAKRLLSGIRHRRTGLRVPKTMVAAAVVLFTAFMVGGGIYDLLDNPPAILPGPRGFISVHPLLNEQTLNESILSMVLTVFVFMGMLTAYRSTQIPYDSKRATTTLILGISLIILGLAGSYYLVLLKRMAG